MTKEEKELLLKDLCARLPYAPKGVYSLKCDSMHPITFDHLTTRYIDRFTTEQKSYTDEIVDIKLYLRPMSSMTEEENAELLMYLNNSTSEKFSSLYYLSDTEQIEFWEERETNKRDWLSANHFDYRGLIPKGLALEAPEDMYKN